MNEVKKQDPTVEFLSELYKTVKMGSDSIINISSKVKDGLLRDELMRELDTYEKYAKRIGKLIYESGNTPKEENIMAKLGAKMGMAMNTMTDSTESHIAQMMIEGATMGITENMKLISTYEKKDVSEDALKLGRDTVRYMEETVENLKKFL